MGRERGALDERYEAWNEAFLDEYFPEGNTGRLAWLPVDDDEIRALAEKHRLGDPATAVADFEAVINSWLATRDGSFTRFTSGVKGWRRVRSTPPYVAGLAFCVHAASRMAGDTAAGIASHNYYAQLNRLIGRDDGAGIPPGFDGLGDAWRDLSRWLDIDCDGRRGLSTFRTNEVAGKHVGFPMSQALLRACDRRRLPDFFKFAGLEPDSNVSAHRMFLFLRAWAALPNCGLTGRARSAIARAEDIDLAEIAETVLRELRAWDGELRDARGRRRAPIHLFVVPRRRGTVVRLLPSRPIGFPDGAWRLEGSGKHFHLEPHSSADGWFAPLQVEVTSAILERGLRLTRGALALAFDTADAIPCRQAAPEIGGYLSQQQATMFEPHLAVIRRHLVQRLKDYLSVCADPVPELRAVGPALPAEWAMTADFRFTSRPRGAQPEFGRLAPKLLAVTSFSGGLQLAGGVYLTGGEPDVSIATDQGNAITPVLDGVAQPLTDGALTLQLSEMGLGAGQHELVADITRRFSTVETWGDLAPAVAGSLGFRLSRHSDYRPQTVLAVPLDSPPPRGEIHISGAVARGAPGDLPLPDRRPALLRAGANRYAIIGIHGEVARPASGKPPAWLEEVGLSDRFQFVEVDPEFDPVWLLSENSAFFKEVTALNPDPPEPAIDGGSWGNWAKVVMQWRDARVAAHLADRWAAYVDRATTLATGRSA